MSMYIILMLWFVCSLRRWSTPSWQPCPWGPSRLQAASPSQTPSTANSRSYPPSVSYHRPPTHSIFRLHTSTCTAPCYFSSLVFRYSSISIVFVIPETHVSALGASFVQYCHEVWWLSCRSHCWRRAIYRCGVFPGSPIHIAAWRWATSLSAAAATMTPAMPVATARLSGTRSSSSWLRTLSHR